MLKNENLKLKIKSLQKTHKNTTRMPARRIARVRRANASRQSSMRGGGTGYCPFDHAQGRPLPPWIHDVSERMCINGEASTDARLRHFADIVGCHPARTLVLNSQLGEKFQQASTSERPKKGTHFPVTRHVSPGTVNPNTRGLSEDPGTIKTKGLGQCGCN